MLRYLGRHLRVAHPLLAIEFLQHLDRGPHVGCELEDADPLGEPHGGVGVPERVGDPLLAVGSGSPIARRCAFVGHLRNAIKSAAVIELFVSIGAKYAGVSVSAARNNSITKWSTVRHNLPCRPTTLSTIYRGAKQRS
jgi:hypothetical protein